MTRRREKLRHDVIAFLKEYARTSRRPNSDPNDRKYDRRVEKRLKQMKPEELDAILRGEDEDRD
jgi:hypothetical protein